ncbi:MAG: hypothetical protein ACOX2N_08500 [Peptococcia bacterium]|jgi:ribosomal protein S27AE
MKRCKSLFSLGFILMMLFSLTTFTYATNETKAGATGLVEFQVDVPSNFTYSVLIDLKHEKGAEYTVKVGAEDEYKVTQEVESGSYFVDIQIVSDENEFCPHCIKQGFSAKHLATLVVVRNRTNHFEVKIKPLKNEKANTSLAKGTEEPVVQKEETEKDVEEGKEDEKKRVTQKILEYVEGDNPNAFEQRESLGKRIIKKNFFTLIMLLLLCIISIYIELKRRL